MRRSVFTAIAVALLLTIACITVNVYFPAAELQQAADKIEDEVRGVPGSSADSELPSDQSMLRRMWQDMAFEGQAYAQIDLDVTTPNIRALIKARAKRFDSLRPFYEKGIIGETNDGLLDIRSLEDLNLKDKGTAKKLVKGENADRENLYEEIAKANDLPLDTVPQIKEMFANSTRKKAEKGWWIQKDDGEWVRKGSK